MNICYFESPIGLLKISEENGFICRIDFVKNRSESESETAVLNQAKEQLSKYFRKELKEFSLPLSIHATDFQQKVWSELKKIPYGETKSYGEIAERIGNPKAQRAVGMANNKNPIPIIIPCHRVIGKNGSLVGYAGGLDIKQKLLDLEQSNKKD